MSSFLGFHLLTPREGMPLVRKQMGGLFRIEMWFRNGGAGRSRKEENQGNEYKWGRKFEDKEMAFPVNFTPPCLAIWSFLLPPETSSFLYPSMALPFRAGSLLPLSHLLVLSQTPFSRFHPVAPSHFAERSPSECHIHGRGWHSAKYLWSLSICFRINLDYLTSFSRPSGFPSGQNGPCTHPCPSSHLWTISRPGR